MPVFTDVASSDRDRRVLPSYAPGLPRVSQDPQAAVSGDTKGEERYEVVVVGAGPSGLLLTLLLARYGLSDASLLCIDGKAGTLKTGQADGLQPRTLEVLKSLGLANEVLEHGCQMWEVGFWNVPKSGQGIERSTYAEDVVVPARFPHEVTIHQGRLERIVSEDLANYSERGVTYNTYVHEVKLEEETDAEYPVVIRAETSSGNGETNGHVRTIRAKHVVGSDGAHSIVRRSMGIPLQGDSKDIIWGVIDLVVDTDFPDIRRRCAIHSNAGSIMIIPREQISNGDYLTRLYVQIDEEDDEDGSNLDAKEAMKRKRAKITLQGLLSQAEKVFSPYKLQLKQGAEVDWWAAYQIGQRMTDRFAVKDSAGTPRVFITGDACHTHSPKAGQGMNVSMMDSYNLSWKLAHSLLGITANATDLLDSYELERKQIARELIEFDAKFSSMFSGKMGSETEGEGSSLTHEQFLEVFSKGSGFTSGCGIEYPQSKLVQQHGNMTKDLNTTQELLNGKLCAGRRLTNAKVIRHADGNPRDLQDDFPSTGRFRILLLCSTDLMNASGNSAKAANDLGHLLGVYPSSLVEMTVLHPVPNMRGCSWKDLPAAIKQHAEMRFHYGLGGQSPVGKDKKNTNLRQSDDAYAIFGIDEDKGGMCVVRPDGYVGVCAPLDDVQSIAAYLDMWLAQKKGVARPC